MEKIRLHCEDGTVYEGDAPETVKGFIQIDKDNVLETDTLNEYLWDALQNLTDNEEDFDTLSENVKRYVSVGSVRNYVGNGGLVSGFYYCPLLLSSAREGYLIMSQPIAAKLVGRMEEALKMAISFNESKAKETNIRYYLDDLTPQQDQIIYDFLCPNNEVIDWSVFDVPEQLAQFVRDNYDEFLECCAPM